MARFLHISVAMIEPKVYQTESLVIIPKKPNREFATEVLRKSIHLLIGLTPLLARFLGRPTTMALLGMGIITYALSESLRQHGIKVPIISRITTLAMRSRDRQGFVLGPLTLGLGALLAVFMYPEPASILALYALAFGDGLSSLVGKLFGSVRIPFTGGKSLEGSLAGFSGVLLASFITFLSLDPLALVIIAVVAMVLEVLPTKDYDNIIIPVGTGLVAFMLLG